MKSAIVISFFTILGRLCVFGQETDDYPHSEFVAIPGADRPDVSSVTSNQFNRYATALKEFMYVNNGEDYKRFVSDHQIKGYFRFGEYVDNTPFNFINDLESEIKKIDSSVTIPSWNYTKFVAGDCRSSDDLFSASKFGSRTTIKGCLADGKFIPPQHHNKGCLKRRSLSRGFKSSYLLSEHDLIDANIYNLWKGFQSNTETLTRHLWTIYGDYTHDPLYFSLQAYHLKLAAAWGLKNMHTVDIDFNGMSIGDEAIYKVNKDTYLGSMD